MCKCKQKIKENDKEGKASLCTHRKKKTTKTKFKTVRRKPLQKTVNKTEHNVSDIRIK